MGNTPILDDSKMDEIIRIVEDQVEKGLRDEDPLYTLPDLCEAVANQLTPYLSQRKSAIALQPAAIAAAAQRLLKFCKDRGNLKRLQWRNGRGSRVTLKGLEKHAEKLNVNSLKQQEDIFKQHYSGRGRGGTKTHGNEATFCKQFIYPHLGLWLRLEDDNVVTWAANLIDDTSRYGGVLTNPDVAAISTTGDYLTLIDYKDSLENWRNWITAAVSYKRFAHEVFVGFPLCKDEDFNQRQSWYGPWQQWDLVKQMKWFAHTAGVGLIFFEHSLEPLSEWEKWSLLLTESQVSSNWRRLRKDKLFEKDKVMHSWYDVCTVHQLQSPQVSNVLLSDVREYCLVREWFPEVFE